MVVRIAWHMSFNAVVDGVIVDSAFSPSSMLRPTIGSGLVISWAGMRGIVFAAAWRCPGRFPFAASSS